MLEFLFNKATGLKAATSLKRDKTPTQVFSCEICEILKSAHFEEYLRMTASM